MQKLPKLHLLSDLKSDKEMFKTIYRVGDYLYAQSASNVAKFSALALYEADLGNLPEEFAIAASDWKVLADGFDPYSYGYEQLDVTDRKGKEHHIELSIIITDDLKEKLEKPYEPGRKPLPEISQSELCISPKWLTNITTACSRRGAAGLVVIEPLSGLQRPEDGNLISAKVIIEEPNDYFVDAVIIADYRGLEPVDGRKFEHQLEEMRYTNTEAKEAEAEIAAQGEIEEKEEDFW